MREKKLFGLAGLLVSLQCISLKKDIRKQFDKTAMPETGRE